MSRFCRRARDGRFRRATVFTPRAPRSQAPAWERTCLRSSSFVAVRSPGRRKQSFRDVCIPKPELGNEEKYGETVASDTDALQLWRDHLKIPGLLASRFIRFIGTTGHLRIRTRRRKRAFADIGGNNLPRRSLAKPPRLFQIVNLNQPNADAAVLAGEHGRELTRQQGDEQS